jgi:hypothetical protein
MLPGSVLPGSVLPGSVLQVLLLREQLLHALLLWEQLLHLVLHALVLQELLPALVLPELLHHLLHYLLRHLLRALLQAPVRLPQEALRPPAMLRLRLLLRTVLPALLRQRLQVMFPRDRGWREPTSIQGLGLWLAINNRYPPTRSQKPADLSAGFWLFLFVLPILGPRTFAENPSFLWLLAGFFSVSRKQMPYGHGFEQT